MVRYALLDANDPGIRYSPAADYAYTSHVGTAEYDGWMDGGMVQRLASPMHYNVNAQKQRLKRVREISWRRA
ncbi:hypothetical protein TWF281_011445 [Arthrobotrys megalospora]